MSDNNLAVNDGTQPLATHPKHVDERFERLERQLTAHGHILESRQPGLPVAGIHRKLALPIPLASYSIGVTCWILGMILLHVQDLQELNGWIILGFPVGCYLTILCGIAEFFCGNTFGTCLFLCVGGGIGGLATNFLPWFAIPTAVAGALGPEHAKAAHGVVDSAAGIYCMFLMSYLFIILIGAQRTAIGFICSLTSVVMTCLCFGVGLMLENKHCMTAAGAFFIVTAVNLFYNGTSMLLHEVGHPFAKFMPIGSLAPRSH